MMWKSTHRIIVEIYLSISDIVEIYLYLCEDLPIELLSKYVYIYIYLSILC